MSLMAGVALAQGPGGMHRGADSFGLMGRMGDMLDLTDAQRDQIKQIFQSGRATVKPLWQQEHASHEAMMQLITSGSFDAAKATTIANQEAQIHAQLEVQHAQLAAQAYQVLTPDQRTKFNEFLAKRQQRMQEHMQKQSEGTSPSGAQ
jgi:periplasmic protein CpxP/Spy